MSEPVAEEGQETPVLITSSSGLAVAHGPGVTISHHGATYPFLADGAMFVKYHQQPTFLNHSGKRLMFYQHNFLFWTKPGVGRPRPGEESAVDPQYQAPLTNILAVKSGKDGKCFSQSKQAMAVPVERAWSLLVRRKDGKEEHVDFEASSREERDKWVKAIQSLVDTAKRTELERDAKVRVVDVAYLVDQQGHVKVSIAPTASSDSSSSAAAAGGPLTVSTATATHRRTKTEDDTPSPQPPHSPQPGAGGTSQHTNTAPTTALHAPADVLSAAGVVITDATNSAPAQRTAATSTSGLDAASSHASDEKLQAALKENAMLKERIAELEEQLKGTHVDSVAAS